MRVLTAPSAWCRLSVLPAALLGALFLLAAAPAASQTVGTQVSNVGQTAAQFGLLGTFKHAQGFTTGANADGYVLTSVEIGFRAAIGTTANLRVELWSATSGGVPDEKEADLTVPSSVGASVVSFTAPSSTALTASTTYFVVAYASGTTTGSIGATESDNEDSGAASGWSIGDARHYQNAGTWTTVSTSSLRIRVNGRTATPTNCDGIWCATLTVKDFNTGYLGCANNDTDTEDKCSTAARLTDNTFPFGGATQNVYWVFVQNNNLNFALTGTPPTALVSGYTLHVGSSSFALSDATPSGNTFTWNGVGNALNWSAGSDVSLRIAQTPSAKVWEATLTVADVTGSLIGCANQEYLGVNNTPRAHDNSVRCSNTSVLDDNNFEYGGATYTLNSIQSTVWNGYLTMEFNKKVQGVLDDLKVCVNGNELLFNDDETQTLGTNQFRGFHPYSNRFIDWAFPISPTGKNTGVSSWTVGQDVKIGIVRTTAACSDEGFTGGQGADPQPPEPQELLTAAFEQVPEAHDGTAAFSFLVRFSAALGTTHSRTLRPAAFAVEHGQVTSVEQVERGLWRVHVAPSSSQAVTIALEARDCDDADAVCTIYGQALSNTASATVAGPPEQQQNSQPTPEPEPTPVSSEEPAPEEPQNEEPPPEPSFDPLQYDANGDGVIAQSELDVAVADWAAGVITDEQFTEVVALFSPAKPVAAPQSAGLGAPYPTPFNAEVVIPFALAEAGPVRLAVYNLMGQQVRVLASGWLAAGVHRVRWAGRTTAGAEASSGVYLVVLHTGVGVQTTKLALIR